MADLAAHWDVAYTRLTDLGLIEEFLRIESDLVVEKYDIFPRDPFFNLTFSFAFDAFVICRVAHVKNYGELLGFFGIVVAPDNKVVTFHTFELFLPHSNFVVGS